MCGKTFKFMVFTILEIALNLGLLTHVSPPDSKLSSKFLSSHRRQREITLPPGSIFPKICFPQQQKGVEETMVCFFRIQSEYEDELEH